MSHVSKSRHYTTEYNGPKRHTTTEYNPVDSQLSMAPSSTVNNRLLVAVGDHLILAKILFCTH